MKQVTMNCFFENVQSDKVGLGKAQTSEKTQIYYLVVDGVVLIHNWLINKQIYPAMWSPSFQANHVANIFRVSTKCPQF